MAICDQEMVSPGLETETRLDDIYETKRGAAPLTANGLGHCVTEWLCYGLIFPLKPIKKTTTNSDSSSLTNFLSVSWQQQLKAHSLSLLLWDAQVHKYWLSCRQIIRITNVNPVVDLALVWPLISAWHSWKVTQLPQKADRKWSVNWRVGLCV